MSHPSSSTTTFLGNGPFRSQQAIANSNPKITNEIPSSGEENNSLIIINYGGLKRPTLGTQSTKSQVRENGQNGRSQTNFLELGKLEYKDNLPTESENEKEQLVSVPLSHPAMGSRNSVPQIELSISDDVGVFDTIELKENENSSLIASASPTEPRLKKFVECYKEWEAIVKTNASRNTSRPYMVSSPKMMYRYCAISVAFLVFSSLLPQSNLSRFVFLSLATVMLAVGIYQYRQSIVAGAQVEELRVSSPVRFPHLIAGDNTTPFQIVGIHPDVPSLLPAPIKIERSQVIAHLREGLREMLVQLRDLHNWTASKSLQQAHGIQTPEELVQIRSAYYAKSNALEFQQARWMIYVCRMLIRDLDPAHAPVEDGYEFRVGGFLEDHLLKLDPAGMTLIRDGDDIFGVAVLHKPNPPEAAPNGRWKTSLAMFLNFRNWNWFGAKATRKSSDRQYRTTEKPVKAIAPDPIDLEESRAPDPFDGDESLGLTLIILKTMAQTQKS